MFDLSMIKCKKYPDEALMMALSTTTI